MSPYPEQTDFTAPSGRISVRSDNVGGENGITISGEVTGLPATTATGGGMHVHVGTSCETHDGVGGHYKGSFDPDDPWTSTPKYQTGADDTAVINFFVAGFTVEEVTGRTFVMHKDDSDAGNPRAACGVLELGTIHTDDSDQSTSSSASSDGDQSTSSSASSDGNQGNGGNAALNGDDDDGKFCDCLLVLYQTCRVSILGMLQSGF